MQFTKVPDKELIERVNLARSSAGLSIKSLAELANVPFGTLTKYLSGHHAMPARVLPGIAQALDVSADWLLTGEPARLHPKVLKRAMGHLMVMSGAPSAEEMARRFYHIYCQDYLWRFSKRADLDLWFVEFYKRLNADDTAKSK
jgi:transcriptional regulator with XRE-family HTH domain